MPRRVLDQYETPPQYVDPLLGLIGSLAGLVVYEPCVGRGHISQFLTDARQLITNDLDPAAPALMHEDARTEAAWPDPSYSVLGPGADDNLLDWTITNPPFRDELAILEHAVRCSRNVAFLARLSFLEPTIKRAIWWCAHPPTDVIVLPRYSFRNDDRGHRQTDNVTCCWIVYRAGRAPCLSFSTVRR